jgi:uncharacterized membrane protein YdbT with pleckstrin-like domain
LQPRTAAGLHFFFVGLPKNEADIAEDKMRSEIELVDHDIANVTTLLFWASVQQHLTVCHEALKMRSLIISVACIDHMDTKGQSARFSSSNMIVLPLVFALTLVAWWSIGWLSTDSESLMPCLSL